MLAQAAVLGYLKTQHAPPPVNLVLFMLSPFFRALLRVVRVCTQRRRGHVTQDYDAVRSSASGEGPPESESSASDTHSPGSGAAVRPKQRVWSRGSAAQVHPEMMVHSSASDDETASMVSSSLSSSEALDKMSKKQLEEKKDADAEILEEEALEAFLRKEKGQSADILQEKLKDLQERISLQLHQIERKGKEQSEALLEEVKLARSARPQKSDSSTLRRDGVDHQDRTSEDRKDAVLLMEGSPPGDDARGDVDELRRRVDHLHVSFEDLRAEMRSSRSDIEGLLGKIAASVDALHAHNESASAKPAGQIYRDAPRLPRAAGLVPVPNTTRIAGDPTDGI